MLYIKLLSELKRSKLNMKGNNIYDMVYSARAGL